MLVFNLCLLFGSELRSEKPPVMPSPPPLTRTFLSIYFGESNVARCSFGLFYFHDKSLLFSSMLVLVDATLPSKALPCVLIMIRSLAGEGNLDFASLLGSFLIVLVCFGGTWSFFLLAWSKASFGDPGTISLKDELLVTKSCF